MEVDSNRQESDLVELMRKKMQMSADNFSSRNFEAMSQFMNGGGGSSDLFSNNGIDGGGGVMTTVIQGQGRGKGGEQTQVFADSRSASIQGTVRSEEPQQLPPWIEEKLRQEGLLNGNQKITATATQKKILISNSSTAGVTRSYSSNSGFPIPSSSSANNMMLNQGHGQVQVEEIGPGGEITPLTSTTRNSPFGIPLSPRRSPFTFRNFEGPLWTNNIFPIESDLLKNNRKTWDLSSDLKTRTQVQFSASQSQHVFESSSNGSFR